MIGSEGVVGDFRTAVRLEPRGVDEHLTYPGNAIAACPEETINEFDFALSRAQGDLPCLPGLLPADAGDRLAHVHEVRQVPGRGGREGDRPRRASRARSSCTPASSSSPPATTRTSRCYGEYGYGIFPQVITLQQLNRLLDPEGPTGGTAAAATAAARGASASCTAWARGRWTGVNAPGPTARCNDYCARTCCTAALHAALELKERFPRARITTSTRTSAPTAAATRSTTSRRAEKGVLFVRFDPMHPPRVERDTGDQSPLVVRTIDLLTGGLELEVPLDLLVLATGVVPHDISELVTMYRCAVGYDRFLLEVHPKLRPVELAVSGRVPGRLLPGADGHHRGLRGRRRPPPRRPRR